MKQVNKPNRNLKKRLTHITEKESEYRQTEESKFQSIGSINNLMFENEDPESDTFNMKNSDPNNLV